MIYIIRLYVRHLTQSLAHNKCSKDVIYKKISHKIVCVSFYFQEILICCLCSEILRQSYNKFMLKDMIEVSRERLIWIGISFLTSSSI